MKHKLTVYKNENGQETETVILDNMDNMSIIGEREILTFLDADAVIIYAIPAMRFSKVEKMSDESASVVALKSPK